MNNFLKLITLGILTPALIPGLSARVMAQTTSPQPPLLQVAGTLQPGDATLDNGRFYDIHEFTGQADQTVTLLLESDAFDAYLILEDGQGNRIATNNNIHSGDTNAALIITLPAAGRYRVLANAFQADAQGSYRLTVQPTLDGQPNPLLSVAEVTLLTADQQLEAGIARVWQSDFRAALALWEAALAGYRARAVRTAFPDDSRRGEAAALGNLGLAYFSLGDYERAIDFQQQALEIALQIGDRHGEAASLGNLGNAYYSLGDYERAIGFLQQTLDINRQIGNRQGEANSLGNLGNAYYSLGDYEHAIDFHQQHLDIARQIGGRQGESISLHNLGVAYRDLADLATAAGYFQASAQVQESLHSSGLADANRLSLLDSQQVTYRLWQQTLIEQDQPERALEVAERGRAQALTASVARSLITEGNEFVTPTPPDLEAIQAIAAAQNATLVEYSVLLSGRIYIWVIQPDGTLHFAETAAAALAETAEVFMTLGQNPRGGDSPETPLNTLVQATQAALTVRGGSADASAQVSRQQLASHLQQLYAVLIAPIAQWLPEDDTQRVIFIPHRELFRIPFAALQDDAGNYLIEKHTLLTAPSIQSLALARQHQQRLQKTNTTDALIVGNPTLPDELKQAYGWQALPGAETEARKVGSYLSQHLGTVLDILFHDQATETRVKEDLHTARFIHLATHGTLASGREDAIATTSEASSQEQTDLLPSGLQYSTIPGVLALAASDHDDGSLTPDELLAMTIDQPLNAELVVLSACQTGQGRITSDGVDGFARTLLTAGVPTLMVSLWNASDHQTMVLMDEFYRQFLEADQDKAQALRQAMLMMIEQGDENPQHWAAFTLMGDPQ